LQNTTHQNGKTSGSIFDPAWKGTLKALRTMLVLSKIVIPVTFILVTLNKLNWLLPVAGLFQPLLKAFGLPGEAALPLLLGFFVNFYAAIGAIAVLSLSPRQITVIGLMILTSHNLLMESPVLKLTGLSPLASMVLRITGAMTFGFILNICYTVFGG
jgi:hypothetical protein